MKPDIKLEAFLFMFILCTAFFFQPAVFAGDLSREANEARRKTLELEYGYSISIEEDILESEDFYPPESGLNTAEKREARILNDIEAALSMLPEGFAREVNKIYSDRGYSPEIIIRERKAIDPPNSIAQWILSLPITAKAEIHIYAFGDILVDTLLHEFGHQAEDAANFQNPAAVKNLRLIFESQNAPVEYSRKQNNEGGDDYSSAFVSLYATTSFREDFAELFSDALTRPLDISALGDGGKLPLHTKIRAMSVMLEIEFASLSGQKFLMDSFQ